MPKHATRFAEVRVQIFSPLSLHHHIHSLPSALSPSVIMLLAPPHSSTSRWPQSVHVAFPASYETQQQQQPLTPVAAGKRSVPYVPAGWAKRKRSSGANDEEEEAVPCQEDAQVTKRSRYIPLPLQSVSLTCS